MSTALPLEFQVTPAGKDAPVRGANLSLALLLAINLFNYVDRYILSAVEPEMRKQFGVSQGKMGLAGTAFLLSYMIISPIFGWLADRMSRWVLVGVGVILWSLASGATGMAGTFGVLLLTRCFVGVGEAAYGPVAPTIISDLYPVKHRGRVLSLFNVAMPVGGALGFALGGLIMAKWGWHAAFYAVVPPGVILGALALFMKDARGAADAAAGITIDERHHATFADYLVLLKVRSYVLCTLGMAAMTFAIGGIAFWMPHYIVEYRHYSNLKNANLAFGAITIVAGLFATLAGGWVGDKLRGRYSGSYFLVSGSAMLIGFPLLMGMLFVPFPMAYAFIFLAVFALFFNTGPTNAILANVTHPSIRATGFAVNIFLIHLLGDAAAMPVIGWMSDHWGMNFAFTVVSLFVLIGGVIWLWGAKYLGEDTANATRQLQPVGGFPVIQ